MSHHDDLEANPEALPAQEGPRKDKKASEEITEASPRVILDAKFEPLSAQKGSEKANTQPSKVIPYYKLYSCADTIDIILIIIGTVAAIVDGLLLVYRIRFWGQTIDFISDLHAKPEKFHQVIEVVKKLLYMGIAATVASFIRGICWAVSAERQVSNLRYSYLRSLLRQDITFFDEEIKTGQVIGNMSRDIGRTDAAIGYRVGLFIKLMATFIGGMIMAFSQAWQLAAVMCWTILPITLFGHFGIKILIRECVNEGVAYAKGDSVVLEALASIRTVISLNGERQTMSKYEKTLEEVQRSLTRAGIVAGGSIISLIDFIEYCGFSLIIWYGSRFVLDDRYSRGDLITVATYINSGTSCLVNALGNFSAFPRGRVAASNIFRIINRESRIDAFDSHGKTLDHVEGEIEFRNVSFRYPSRRNIEVLSNFSLTITHGSKTALVGKSGCGKSTVVSLIQRYYDPDSGGIFIDGFDLKELRLEHLRKKIGLVSQEPVLFTLSIKDNITFGRDDVTEEEIRAAISLANAEKFLKELPQGLDTMVGENGVQLSGGQKQRIAIARAILKNPRIILLDEATSALDLESQQIVVDSLNKISVGRTTLLITHRMSTVANANKIFVLERGSIVEEGTYSELMDQNGPFCQLIQMQNIREESNKENSIGPFSMSERASLRKSSGDVFPSSEISYPSKKTIIKFWRFVRLKQVFFLFLGLVATITKALIPIIFGVIIAYVIGAFNLEAGRLQKEIKFWCIIIAVVALISPVAAVSQKYILIQASCWLLRVVNPLCFNKIVHMEVDWFDHVDNSSGALSSRLSTIAETLTKFIRDAAPQVVQHAVTVIAGLVVVLSGSWQLAVLSLAFIPLVLFNGWLELKFNGNSSKIIKVLYEEAGQVTKDAVEHIRTVASFSADKQVLQLFKLKCEGPLKKRIKCAYAEGASYGLSSFLLYFIYGATFYVGANLIRDGRATSTTFYLALFALTDEVLNVTNWLGLLKEFNVVKPCLRSVSSILNLESKLDSSLDTGLTIESLKGSIEFQHVNFSYSSRPHIQVLKDFCLSIPAGKTAALVGESGSGKSTIISLLQRFYNFNSGLILIDDIEIQKLNINWLRKQMALVSQEPALFDDTIKANITFGLDRDVSEAEIISAASLANAHHFISNLPQGYDTEVGQRGVKLSGGQKQRIAIARAIVRRPKILLLDEPTSALDLSSEQVVQEALNEVMVNRTTIVAAHRLSTIKHADIIAVMRHGVIAELGTHESLLKSQNGIYASLVALS
ncbi:ABC transporter B family member 5-like [Coffea eugenioides]|uniref:ABC transporter B family member 5-like n=1 Tax=Coffea eugenioides TaxID=49369 RepID=UPI000F611209|nr:ABC transporter B family member 5-like [Coffea eugenioides]